MAKRFTDTNKYRNPFFRGLKGPYKLLWDFLYHHCDNAGIWIVDFEEAQKYVGKDMKIAEDLALSFFNEDETRVVPISEGKKWFIPSFIEFQYSRLSEKNKAHTGIISQLVKYHLLNEDLSIRTILRPLEGSLQGPKDKDKEQDKDKGGAGGEKPKKEFVAPTLDEFKRYFTENGYSQELAERAWRGYEEANWHDSQGNPVKNWKSKCQHVWFSDKNSSHRISPDITQHPNYDKDLEMDIKIKRQIGVDLEERHIKYLVETGRQA